MLAEDTKEGLVECFRLMTARGRIEAFMQEGSPRDFLKYFIEEAGKSPHQGERELAAEIRDNYEEAVQVIGGVLGMM